MKTESGTTLSGSKRGRGESESEESEYEGESDDKDDDFKVFGRVIFTGLKMAVKK